MESAKSDLQKAQAHYQECCRNASAAQKQKNTASDFKVWLHWLNVAPGFVTANIIPAALISL